MLARRDHDELVVEQCFRDQVFVVERAARHDGEVELIGAQFGDDVAAVPGDVDRHSRRGALKAPDDGREQDHGDVVGGADVDAALRRRRVELLRLEDALYHLETLGERLDQALGARRQLPLAGRERDQFVAEHLAQALQRVAQGRLAETELLPGPREIAVAEQRLQDRQQVEIVAAQRHGSGGDG
jgi:hypothetical protein